MKPLRTLLTAAVVAGLAAALPAVAHAGPKSSGKTGSKAESAGGTRTVNVDPTASGPKALAAAKKQRGEAQAEINRAKATMNRLRMKQQTALEAKAEWKAAQADLRKAKAEYDAASRVVLVSARATPAYRAARAERERAQLLLRTARAGGGSASLIATDAKGGSELKDAVAAMEEIENAAVAGDTKAAASRAKLDEAQARVDGMKAELEAALMGDSEYATAKTRLETGEQKLEESKALVSQIIQNRKDELASIRLAEIEAREAKKRGKL